MLLENPAQKGLKFNIEKINWIQLIRVLIGIEWVRYYVPKVSLKTSYQYRILRHLLITKVQKFMIFTDQFVGLCVFIEFYAFHVCAAFDSNAKREGI